MQVGKSLFLELKLLFQINQHFVRKLPQITSDKMGYQG